MKALVFAAGLGTRLRPITDAIPKALVKVGGVPLLARVIEKLKLAGYDDVTVNVHHFADQIVSYLELNDNFGIRISVSDERDMLRETGGGVRHAAKYLRGEGRFLVHNVDILSNLDLEWFAAQCRESDLATILVSGRTTQRYFLFDGEMRLVGWTNTSTGEVRSPYGAIDVSKYRKLAFSGIHMMSEEILDLMEPWPEAFPIVDFYLEQCRSHTIRGVVMDGLQMRDVGKIADLSEMENVLPDESGGCPAMPL